ncbi:MAG: YceI family protein [Mycobacteriaceae bacterium]|nr:YceI family protein [Mycobacteriaceae bacterium]MBV9638660.1 YceI family protein [Mycobacteriaceae bacterium]
MPGRALETLDASDGELLVRTAVTGRAARMGHRLTIKMNRWHATVRWDGSEPSAAELTVDVDSLQVLYGEGGVTPLSGPEKGLVRANAIKVLEAARFPHIRFHTDDIAATSQGYRLDGTLEIHGRSTRRVIEVRVQTLGDSRRMSSQAQVRQSEFGIKPYSMFMGAMKVADDVTVSFTAETVDGD